MRDSQVDLAIDLGTHLDVTYFDDKQNLLKIWTWFPFNIYVFDDCFYFLDQLFLEYKNKNIFAVQLTLLMLLSRFCNPVFDNF